LMQLVLKSTEICNVRYVLESCIKIVSKQGSFSKPFFTFPLLNCTTQGCGEKKNHGVSSEIHYSLHGFSSLHSPVYRSVKEKYLNVLKKSLVWLSA